MFITQIKMAVFSIKQKERHQKALKWPKRADAYQLVSPSRHPMELVYADYAKFDRKLWLIQQGKNS